MMGLMNSIMTIIRKEIETCRFSRYRIGKDTGISEKQLHRIVKQGGTLIAETADMLLEYFGYEIRKKKGKGGK